MTTPTQLTIEGPKPPLVALTIRKGLTDTVYNFNDFATELDGIGEGFTLTGVEPADAILTDAEYNRLNQVYRTVPVQRQIRVS